MAEAAGVDERTTLSRKADHIRINVEEDVSAKGVSSGFERYRFEHVALPEMDLLGVQTGTELFGYKLSVPLLISCMTGGVPEAERINRTLAETAQQSGLALGLGSGRVLLERPEVLSSFAVRDLAPNVPLLANLGAVQLNRGIGPDECRRIVDLLCADALVLHLNPLQEALQLEGDTNFGGLLSKIANLCVTLGAPVLVKEIGWGISPDLVLKLLDAGVAGVDVAGAGGTSWSEVERHRLGNQLRAGVAAAFAGWGIPTAQALTGARRVAPEALLFASGGIRTGIDAAKALALGADMVGLAGPFLRAAAESPEAALRLAQETTEVLRTTMFVVGAAAIDDLRHTVRLHLVDAPSPFTVREQLRFSTSRRLDFVDITDDLQAAVARSGVREGLAHVASDHTTAAVRVNENEPLLLDDFRALLDRLAPVGASAAESSGQTAVYAHDDLSRRIDVGPEEPLNGHSHCQHLLLSTAETLTVAAGKAQLGPWQRVFLIELDAPRTRTVSVQVIGS